MAILFGSRLDKRLGNAWKSVMEPVSNIKIHSRISQRKISRILRLFSVDLNAVQIAELTDLHRNTVNRYLKLIHTVIAQYCEEQSPFSGVVEVDE